MLEQWIDGPKYKSFINDPKNPWYRFSDDPPCNFVAYLIRGASKLNHWVANAGPPDTNDFNEKSARKEVHQYMSHLQRTLPSLREIALEEITILQTKGISISQGLLEEHAPPILKLLVTLVDIDGFDIGVQEKDKEGIWQPCGMLDAVRRVLIGQDKTLDIGVFRERTELRFNPIDHIMIGRGWPEDMGFQQALEKSVDGGAQEPKKMVQQSLEQKMSATNPTFSISLLCAAFRRPNTDAITFSYIRKHIKRLIIEAHNDLQEVERQGTYRGKGLQTKFLDITTANPLAVTLLADLHDQLEFTAQDEWIKKAIEAAATFSAQTNNNKDVSAIKRAAKQAKEALNLAVERIIREQQEAQEASKKTWVGKMAPGVDVALLKAMHQKSRENSFPLLLFQGFEHPERAPTERDWFMANTKQIANLMIASFDLMTSQHTPGFDEKCVAQMRKTILMSPDQLGGKKDFLDEATKTVAIGAEISKMKSRYPDSKVDLSAKLSEVHTSKFDVHGMPSEDDKQCQIQTMIRSRKLYIEVLEVYAKHLQAQEENASKPVSSPAPATTTAASSSNSSSSSASAPAPQVKHTYKEVKEHLDLCKGQLAALELMSSRDDKAIEAFAKRAVYTIPGLLAVAGGVFSAKFIDTKLAKEALDAINDMFKNQWDKLGQGLASGNPALLAMVIGIGLCATGLVFGLWKGAAVAHRIEARTHNYDEGLKYFVTEMHQYLTTEQKNLPEPVPQRS
ncbi:MAG: hypothetical protein JSS50_04790 [Proteobacteria bacterium]|nr:hypothetical protein [Pseudomonadota bacterium]